MGGMSDPLQEELQLSADEYYEAEAMAIATDILDRSYRYGDNLEPLARAYKALAQRVEDAEGALRNIAHTDDAEHARELARQALRQEETQ